MRDYFVFKDRAVNLCPADCEELIQRCSRNENEMGKAAGVGDMINKKRSLRSKGGEDGRCHPEQSGVISYGQEGE